MKIAVVTGANKGIGLGIVEKLLKKLDSKEWKVYLTSRDEGRGKQAAASLEAKGLKPCSHKLDLDDADSCKAFADYLKSNYGGIDILVNNAGIAYNMNATEPFTEQVEVTLRTNFWGTLHVCDALVPLIRDGGRMVNMSSRSAHFMLAKFNPEMLSKVKSPMSIDEIKKFITQFSDAVKAGRHKEEGFPESAYGLSKVGMTLFGMTLARDLKKSGKNIVVFNCCPGMVKTDMTNQHASGKSTNEGADTPVYLAVEMDSSTASKHSGEFFGERKVIPWDEQVGIELLKVMQAAHSSKE